MATRIYNGPKSPTVYVERSGVVNPRSSKGWTENNPYSSLYATASGDQPHVSMSLHANESWHELEPIPVSTYNRVYSKFLESAAGSKGELMTSTVEWKSSLGMITQRALQLRNAYLALRRFDLPQVARHLSLSKPDAKFVQGQIRKGGRKQTLSAMWLEYWMGWAPLIGDIHFAMERLSAPPSNHVTLSESVGFSWDYERKYGSDHSASQLYYVNSVKTSGRLALYGKAEVTNHNLFLANALGFTNPALVAWQIVPFSFIVDWFTNVGQFISRLTDFAGLRVFETGYAVKRVSKIKRYGYRRLGGWWDDKTYFSLEGESLDKYRKPGGVIAPRLTLQFPKLSLTRAATAISLLVEIFLLKK